MNADKEKYSQGRWKPPYDKGIQLTREQADEIKTLCAYMDDDELAKQFNVTKLTIQKIRTEETWSWL